MKIFLGLVTVFFVCMGFLHAQETGYKIFGVDTGFGASDYKIKSDFQEARLEVLEKFKPSKFKHNLDAIKQGLIRVLPDLAKIIGSDFDRYETFDRQLTADQQKSVVLQVNIAVYRRAKRFYGRRYDFLQKFNYDNLSKKYYWSDKEPDVKFINAPDAERYKNDPERAADYISDPSMIGREESSGAAVSVPGGAPEPRPEEKIVAASGEPELSGPEETVLRAADALKAFKYLQRHITTISPDKNGVYPKVRIGDSELSWGECVEQLIFWRIHTLGQYASQEVKDAYQQVPDLLKNLLKKIVGAEGYALIDVNYSMSGLSFVDTSETELENIIDRAKRYNNQSLFYCPEDIKEFSIRKSNIWSKVYFNKAKKPVFDKFFGELSNQANMAADPAQRFEQIFRPAYNMYVGKFLGHDFSNEIFIARIQKIVRDYNSMIKYDFGHYIRNEFVKQFIKGYLEKRFGRAQDAVCTKVITALTSYFDNPETLTVEILHDTIKKIIPDAVEIKDAKITRIVGQQASLVDVACARFSESNQFSIEERVIVEQFINHPATYGKINKIYGKELYEVEIKDDFEGLRKRYFAKQSIHESVEKKYSEILNTYPKYKLYPLKKLGKIITEPEFPGRLPEHPRAEEKVLEIPEVVPEIVKVAKTTKRLLYPTEALQVFNYLQEHIKIVSPDYGGMYGAEDPSWGDAVEQLMLWRLNALEEPSAHDIKNAYENVPNLLRNLLKKILGLRGYAFVSLDRSFSDKSDKSEAELDQIIDGAKHYKNQTSFYCSEDIQELCRRMSAVWSKTIFTGQLSYFNTIFGEVRSQACIACHPIQLFSALFQPAYGMLIRKILSRDFSDDEFLETLRKIFKDFDVWVDVPNSDFEHYQRNALVRELVNGYLKKQFGEVNKDLCNKVMAELTTSFDSTGSITIDNLRKVIPVGKLPQERPKEAVESETNKLVKLLEILKRKLGEMTAALTAIRM